jgi:hypothetical protein
MENTMLKRILVLLLFANFAPNAGSTMFAAAPGSIEGVVKDAQSGEVLPGANVAIVGTGFGGSTDVYGKFSIRNLPAGTYTLRVAYIGYASTDQTVTVTEGAPTAKNFSLAPIALQGETVVVTAQAEGQN